MADNDLKEIKNDANSAKREIDMKREQTTIRLPAELRERLQREADRRGDSFNETVIRLIRLGLEFQSGHCSARSLL